MTLRFVSFSYWSHSVVSTVSLQWHYILVGTVWLHWSQSVGSTWYNDIRRSSLLLLRAWCKPTRQMVLYPIAEYYTSLEVVYRANASSRNIYVWCINWRSCVQKFVRGIPEKCFPWRIVGWVERYCPPIARSAAGVMAYQPACFVTNGLLLSGVSVVWYLSWH